MQKEKREEIRISGRATFAFPTPSNHAYDGLELRLRSRRLQASVAGFKRRLLRPNLLQKV